MLTCLSFHKDRVKLVPAVVHQDGTGRVQTISKTGNARIHKLLTKFHEITDIPMLLNTSFNAANEPLVETPKDALSTFRKINLDFCVLGSRIVFKRNTQTINNYLRYEFNLRKGACA
jgi:carbamoyltransferase